MEKEPRQFLRDRITQLRMEKNQSEYQLSLALGKCKTYMQAISSGKSLPSFDAFLDICDHFDLTPAEFFADNLNDTPQLRRIHRKLETLSKEDLALLEQLLEKF